MNSKLISSGKPYNFKNLWNWLGDREVFFCKVKGDLFTNSCETMLECFEVLHYVDGCVFWKLVSDPKSRGLCDEMGHLYDHHVERDGEHIGLFSTHNQDEELEVIEQWMDVPLSWWEQNRSRSDIRKFCEDVLANREQFN